MTRTTGDDGGTVIAFLDSDQDGSSDVQQRFGSFLAGDIKWRAPYLYLSSPTKIVRYHLPGAATTTTAEPELVVEGMPSEFAQEHLTRPFQFDPEGNLYVHIGAPSNSCQQFNRRRESDGVSPCSELENAGGIWKFPGDRVALKFPSDGVRVVTGLRHTLSLAWNSVSRNLQFVQQGRDQLHDLWPARYSKERNARLPSEELLEAGDQSDFGWPYCYHDPFLGYRVLSPEYGGDGAATGECSKFATPLLAFPAHTSPSDILFYRGNQFPSRYKHGAFIAFAGGWGRAPFDQQGFNIVFVPYHSGQPASSYEVFATGFTGVSPVKGPHSAKSRPSGLSEMPDGSLLILDRQGQVLRVSYTGSP